MFKKKKKTECSARRRHSKGTSYLVHRAEQLPVSTIRVVSRKCGQVSLMEPWSEKWKLPFHRGKHWESLLAFLSVWKSWQYRLYIYANLGSSLQLPLLGFLRATFNSRLTDYTNTKGRLLDPGNLGTTGGKKTLSSGCNQDGWVSAADHEGCINPGLTRSWFSWIRPRASRRRAFTLQLTVTSTHTRWPKTLITPGPLSLKMYI